MYNIFQLAGKYFSYYVTASNGKGHGIHSPFIFEFVTNVLNDKSHYPSYPIVEALRTSLSQNNNVLTITDLGAGSAAGKTNHRSVSSIAKNAAKPARFGQLLYRIVRYYQPARILELGTSLGITTSYLSLAKPDATITTLEGAPEIARQAQLNFERLQLGNISLVEGNFDDTLPDQKVVDFAFIDGNHRQQPTIGYFEMILGQCNPASVIVVDDIHWSREMEQAWHTLKNHTAVKCSVDLFFIGIIFLRNEFKEQQHFTIRF